jgi:hypothetical protein
MSAGNKNKSMRGTLKIFIIPLRALTIIVSCTESSRAACPTTLTNEMATLVSGIPYCTPPCQLIIIQEYDFPETV